MNTPRESFIDGGSMFDCDNVIQTRPARAHVCAFLTPLFTENAGGLCEVGRKEVRKKRGESVEYALSE